MMRTHRDQGSCAKGGYISAAAVQGEYTDQGCTTGRLQRLGCTNHNPDPNLNPAPNLNLNQGNAEPV